MKQQPPTSHVVASSKTPTKREIAALSTEYDLLKQQVNDMKQFIKQNEALAQKSATQVSRPKENG